MHCQIAVVPFARTGPLALTLHRRRDGITHLAGAHFFRTRFARVEDIARPMARLDGLAHRCFNRRRGAAPLRARARPLGIESHDCGHQGVLRAHQISPRVQQHASSVVYASLGLVARL